MHQHINLTQDLLSTAEKNIWRTIQLSHWVLGNMIIHYLIFHPHIGIHMFWNILIPIAPAIFVISIGFWRNICPMASVALFPRHMGWSKQKTLTPAQQGILNLISVFALLVIIPLRHIIFNFSGMATAILIMTLSIIAFILGFIYEWKSSWCLSLCPVFQVEKMYGLNSKVKFPNAHCDRCYSCTIPCPETSAGTTPLSTKSTIYQKISGYLIIGGMPGFIWGWYHVQDNPYLSNWIDLFEIYKLPLIGLCLTEALFLLLNKYFNEIKLIRIFSAWAVSGFYWFTIPALIGYGVFPGNGMLYDLTHFIPLWSVKIFTITTTVFFFWWIVFSKQTRKSWTTKPDYVNIDDILLN